MDNQVYARVVNGKIIEYPVYHRHIVARGQDVKLYTRCIEVNRPDDVKASEGLKESRFYSKQEDVVYLTYEKYDLPLEVLLNKFSNNKEKKYKDLSPDMQDALLTQISVYVTRVMDDFAATRRYGSIASCAAYACEGEDKIDKEGRYAKSLMKKVWSIVPDKITEIVANTVDLPTIEEVHGWLPEMKWPSDSDASIVDKQ